MNPLRQRANEYLRVRRSLGYKLVEHERMLNQFLDYLEVNQASTITAENALAWARIPADANPRWHGARLSAVRGFAVWAQAFDADIQVPPTGLLPMRTTRATPYLYSQDQIWALMSAAARLVPPVKAATFQTLIGLLAVTGMRAGEAIRADRHRPRPRRRDPHGPGCQVRKVSPAAAARQCDRGAARLPDDPPHHRPGWNQRAAGVRGRHPADLRQHPGGVQETDRAGWYPPTLGRMPTPDARPAPFVRRQHPARRLPPRRRRRRAAPTAGHLPGTHRTGQHLLVPARRP